MTGCDPLLPLLLPTSQEGFAGLGVCCFAWSHIVLISVVSGSKLVSGKYRGTIESPIMDKQGRILTTEAEQEARLAEHFSEVLNGPPPTTKADVQDPEADLDLNRHHERNTRSWQPSDPSKTEKPRDRTSLSAELFKADPQFAAQVLQPLFAAIWEENSHQKTGQKASS